MKSHHVSHVSVFTRTVGDYMEPAPPTLTTGDNCGAAVELLRAPEVSGVLIVDDGRQPLGIVTEQDVTHRIAYQLDAGESVASAMSAPVTTISRGDYLFQAIALMRREALRHLPVVDDQGLLVGMLHLHRALSESVPLLLEMIEHLTPGDLRTGIEHMKRAQVKIALGLLHDGVPAPEIQTLLTHFNNDIYRRVIRQAMDRLRDEGAGSPPVGFDVIVMGSGGRGESYLFPDQDNGFVLDDYPDADHNQVDAYFIPLAERMTAALHEVGITLCKGFVMASNPLWRKSISQWCEQLQYWLRKPSDATLRLSDIFFDFLPVHGQGENARTLREFVTRTLPERHMFLGRMQAVQRDHGVALGLFKRLTVDDRDGPHKGKLNLKYHGLLPLVENIRLLALREGVASTSTLERIAELHSRNVLSNDEQDYLCGAFQHITHLVLRQQLQDFDANLPVGPYVSPDALSEREKDMLVDGLDAINDLRGRMRGEFSGDIF
jgi:signal-transduction protein with cAMP-binding, CBS, and nucleotidyltransferase domain